MSTPRRQLSPARKFARVLVWGSFAMLLLVRFVFFKEEHPPGMPNGAFWPQAPQQQQRFYRSPTHVQPPVSEVPKDLPRLQIQIAPKDVNTLRGYFWNGWRGQRPQDRPEVMATVEENGVTYTNVSLHLKGAAGSFRPFDDKPAMTLNFNKHAQGQRFHGYAKISLNNSVQDSTFICEAFSRELFNAAGVPTPKADFATVVVNGRDLGFYVMVEGYGKEFLRHHFSNVKGNLYDGGFCQEVTGQLTVNSGEHPDDRSDLAALRAAVYGNVSNRWERLNQVLDMDRFITFLALDVMLCNWDGYALNHNNYRIFHNLETDRMIFMPHGLDQLFDMPPGRFSPEGTIRPGMRGAVANAVLGTPEGSRRYIERMDALSKEMFQPDPLVARIHQLQARIRPTLAAYSPSMAEWHDSAVESLCDRVSRRARSVAEQLHRPSETLDFMESGSVDLRDWNMHVGSQGASFQFDTVKENGKELLHISTQGPAGTGSWRTRVVLAAGRYRLEGRAKAAGVSPNSRLTLRVSGNKQVMGRPVTGSDWIPLSYSFRSEPFSSEVVLVCEFNSASGEAWFDVESLRLIKE